MSFRDDYLKLPPGPARDALAYKAIITQGPPKNLVPVTIDGPGGTKISYKVMPDYVMVDGMRVSIPPSVAQKVANQWDMSLPTAKMSKQIYNAATTKVRATPLSASGYTGADGKHYSAQDVTASRIGASDAVAHYNDLTNKEIDKAGPNPGLIAGHGKDILEPLGDPNDVSLGGWHGKNNEALQPYSIAHRGEAEHHTEYGLWTRLVDDKDVTVTMPDGKVIHTTMEKLRSNPNLSKAVADSTTIKKYNTGGVTPAPVTGIPGALPGAGAPPPKGYARLPEDEKTQEISQKAASLLKGEYGTVTEFNSGGKQYAARVEPHFHPAPPPGGDPAKYPKPWGWHKGVTVYKAAPGGAAPVEVAYTPNKPQSGRLSLLQRIDDVLNQFGQG